MPRNRVTIIRQFRGKVHQSVLALATSTGELDCISRTVALVSELDVDAIVLTGNLTGTGKKAEQFRGIFKALSRAPVTSFYVPVPADAPVEEYLRVAYNIEIVFPYLHSVHGSFAFSSGHVLVAGMGGRIHDLETGREETTSLSYPTWEAEYRLKVLNELKDYQKIMLFSSAPAHKGLHESGSDALAELIKTHNPRLVVACDESHTGSTL